MPDKNFQPLFLDLQRFMCSIFTLKLYLFIVEISILDNWRNQSDV